MSNYRKNCAMAGMWFAGAMGVASLSPARAQTPVSTATSVTDDACARLATLPLDRVVITSAGMQAAMAQVPGANLPGMTGQPGSGPAISGLPGFCRVVGHIHPEAGSDIKFEIWLPMSEKWTGRLNGAGNGGLAGSLSYNDLASAVRAGQVGASTDTGHTGSPMESGWAKGHPERIRDYGWRAIHLTTVAAKALTKDFYGREPDKSYFVGCSNGGRMALMEASRFPEDYDGIVAGAPASVITELLMTHMWLTQVQMPVGAAIRPEQVSLIQSEVLKQCDGIDGRVDGLVADPRQCRFDAAKLACGDNSSALCLTPPQLTAFRKIQDGPRTAAGRRVAFGFPATGSEMGVPVPFFGWNGTIAKGGQTGPLRSAFPDVLTDFPAVPIATDSSFNVNTDPARVNAALAGELNPQPDLSRFFARGGKLILWHGWADATIPPQYTLAFHDRILRASGPLASKQMRLFMMPGVQHCFGGPGADVFGQIGAPPQDDSAERNIAVAAQDWVEKGRVPEMLVGRLGLAGMMGMPARGPEKQRLICAFPKRAVLRAGEDSDKATSYECNKAQQ